MVDTASAAYQFGVLCTKIDTMVEKTDRLIWRQDDAERRIEVLENYQSERRKPNQWTDRLLTGILLLNLGTVAWILRGLA